MRKTWNEQEEKYLCENFPTENLKVMSAKLGRDIRAVRAAAQRRGLKRKEAGGRGRAVLSDTHLCWYCKHSLDKPIGYCSWANDLTPVEGWETKKRKSGRFAVVNCPLYEMG